MALEENIFMIKYQPFLTRYNLFNLNQFCVQIGLLWVKFSMRNSCIPVITLRPYFFLIKVSTCWVAYGYVFLISLKGSCRWLMRHMKGIRCLRIV